MPENPVSPVPPAPAKKRKAPGPINKKYLDEIELIRDLVPQAQKADRTALLTAAAWAPARITALGAKADALETAALAAVGRTKARQLDTAAEAEARRVVLAAIHPVRAGAKRKYRNGPDAAAGRSAFFVNEPTGVSLERLLFIAGSMHRRLTPQPPALTPEDTLPGVTAAVLTALQTAHTAYTAADAGQHDTESEKREAHTALLGAYTTAHEERFDLQLAADQSWSPHDSANAAIRGDFRIPPDRPMTE
jgi:hypothetical protein